MTTNPLFTAAIPALTDDLAGAVPSWRLGAEPIYLDVVRDLGVPGTLEGPAPAEVVAGEVVDAPTASLTLVEQPAPQPAARKPRTQRQQPRKRTSRAAS